MRKPSRVVLIVTTIGIVALLLSIALPTINRMRESTGGRNPCASNLRQLGQGLLLYAQDHGGSWPATLAELVHSENVQPSSLNCNVADKPFVFLRPSARAASVKPDDLIVYEPLDYHSGGGAFGLFGDGRVQWLTPDELRSALARGTTTNATTLPAS